MDVDLPLASIIIKLASRCNLKCTYCYWFKDPDVYLHPPRLTEAAENSFILRLEQHLREYSLNYFDIIFHGGEPLLFGKRRFISFLLKLDQVKKKTKSRFEYSITTNGVTIDKDWANLFRIFDVQVCISIDGAKEIHDKYRPDLRGKGSYDRTVAGIEILRSEGIEPTVISVCDPTSDPKLLLATLVDELCLDRIDILIPDANHELGCQSIAKYYIRLIDLWFDTYAEKNIRVKILDGMIRSVLGLQSETQSIGIGRVKTVILNPGGELEPLDVLRIAGHKQTETDVDVFKNPLQDIVKNDKWRSVYRTSYNLAKDCQRCDIKEACGAGDLAQRWSAENGYDNVSVYCEDYKEIFHHLSARLLERSAHLEKCLVHG